MRNPFGRAAERGRGWVSEMRGTFSAGGTPEMGPNMEMGQASINGAPLYVPQIWGYYDAVGEFHFDARFMSLCLSRCTLRLGVLDVDNKVGPAFDEDGDVLEGVPVRLAKLGARMIAGLRSAPGQPGPAGGHGMLLSRMGANLFSVAICFLVASETPMGTHWEVLSTMELQPVTTPEGEKQRFRRRRHRGTPWEDFTPTFYLPIYDPHPAWSGDPDSGALSLATVLERISLLNDEGLADSKSRLTRGVYWISTDADFPGTDEDPDGANYMSRELIKVATQAIRDPQSAARQVPLVARASTDVIDRGTKFERFEYDSSELIEKRASAVGDLARGAPLPYEMTMGMSESSFANSFSAEGQLSRIFVPPVLDTITGCLTAGWFTKGLMQATGQPFDQPPSEDVQRLVVWYDISELVTDPDPTKVAQWAYGTDTNPNNIINAKGVRRLLGIPEGERPTAEETSERLARAKELRARSEQGNNNPDTSPDEPNAPPDGERDTDEEVGKRVLSLANMAVSMAVQTVGSKLRAKCAKKPEYLRRIDGIDAADVARVLGPATVEVLGGTGPLFNGSFHAFGHTVMREFSDIGRVDAADLAAAAVKMVERASLARLGNPAAVIDTHAAADFLALLNN